MARPFNTKNGNFKALLVSQDYDYDLGSGFARRKQTF
jgi:hypothetical protein